MAYNDPQLTAVLNDARRNTSIGLSRRIESPSNEVAVYLRSKGFDMIPVNPTNPKILGSRRYQCVSDLSSRIDLVVVYRRSRNIFNVARDVIEASPKYRWLQLAIRNDEAALDIESRGIRVYPDICIEQTHQRLAKANMLKHQA